jgi:hypothetical protein
MTPPRDAGALTIKSGACLTATSIRTLTRPLTSPDPCVELWFILHFEDQTAYLERQTAQRRD